MVLQANAVVALAAAASWGGGDFSGGLGVKAAGGTTAGALRLVIVAHAVSLLAVLVGIWLWPVPWPHGTLLAWGLIGGCSQALSLTAFYIALARGAMGASAAVSGLIAASIPAIFSGWVEGTPTSLRLVGFALAAAAIWLIAAGPSADDVTAAYRRKTMLLAIFGGIGFGFYFVTMRLTNSLGLLMPMVLVRASCLMCCVAMLAAMRLGQRVPSKLVSGKPSSWLSRTALLCALGVAVLDTGGNMLFMAATRLGRLDVAAVLSSLYPAGTILLAAWVLRERPSGRQIAGMALALAAVVLITV